MQEDENFKRKNFQYSQRNEKKIRTIKQKQGAILKRGGLEKSFLKLGMLIEINSIKELENKTEKNLIESREKDMKNMI